MIRSAKRSPGALALAGCLLVFATSYAAVPNPDARAAADDWLAFIDARDYERGWNEAGTLLKAGAPAERWTREVSDLRSKAGQVEARQFADAYAVNPLPGMPRGDYVAVRYQTAFARAGTVTEEVVLARDGDRWRVVGYHLDADGQR